MKDPPEISVIVPVYKGIRFLREALGSVKAQTFPDWECICVDDGSKDGSGALADEIAATEPRIRVIHQANRGTSVARNTALKDVRGKYVAFLDEDDVYNPRMLETLHAVAERTGADVVGCDEFWIRENDHPVFSQEGIPDEKTWRVADRRKIAEWMAEMYPGIPYEIWRNLYRREAIADHWFVPGIRVEQDLMWHYTLMPKISKYVRIDWKGYAWRSTSAGGFNRPDPESLISLTKTYHLLATETVVKIGMDEAQRRRFAYRMSQELHHNLWEHLWHGLDLTRDESRRMRSNLRRLLRLGVDVRQELGRKKRIQWTLFMLTGSTWWVRK